VLVQRVEKGARDGRPFVACEGDDWTDKTRFGGSREFLGTVGDDVIGNQGGAEAGGCEEGRGDDLAGANGDARLEAGGGALYVHYLGKPVASREMDPPPIG
jgi:hypothetical protein